MLRRMAILLAIMLLPILSAVAQTRNISQHALTPSNGLSHVSVTSLHQDSNGAIWIATRDGLNRYDGSEITVFRRDRNNPNSLTSNNVIYLVGDNERYLYIMCSDGVSRLDIDTEQFKVICEETVGAIEWCGSFYVASGNKIERWIDEEDRFEEYFVHEDNSVVIRYMCMDSRGTMWIGTQDHGLYTFNSAALCTNIVESGNITNIFEDSSGDMWFGSWNDGLYHYDRASGNVHNYRHLQGDKSTLSSNFVRDVAQDNQGNIWVGTSDGICCYSAENKCFTRYDSGENNSSVWSVMRDAQGTIWFSSYFGGVSWFNPEYSIFLSYKTIDSYSATVEQTVIGKMVEDKDGLLWICTEGSGVYIYNRELGEFNELLPRDRFGANIKAICYDQSRDIMWFGTHLGGLYSYHISSGKLKNYRYNPADRWSIPSDIIRDIELRDEKLILATFNGVATFDPKTGRSERMFIDTQLGRKILSVSNILVSSDDNLWIAADGQGIFRYIFKQKSLSNYRPRKDDINSLSSNNISTIIEDQSATIWIGHEGTGVDRFNSESDDFTNFDTKSAGIIGDRIYEICDNCDGSLSISTGEGVSIFDTRTLNSYSYSNQMGYSLLSPNENAMCRTHDNLVFIGGVDGLISFDLNRLINTQKRAYAILLSNLYVNQKLLLPNDGSEVLTKIIKKTDSVVLPSSTDSFSVDFTTTNYIPEIDESVVYRLQGFEDEWIASRTNHITYTNIPPGNYTLQLKSASNSDNVQGVSLDVVIRQIWYKTAWAWMVYLIIITLLVNYLHTLYRQRLQLSAQVRYEQDRIVDIEKQNHSKLQFFTNISHEFRTPLSVIIGQIELLLNSKQLSTAARAKVLSIYKSSSELNSLIGELLDFRKHEQGHLKLKIQQANLSALFAEIHDLYFDYISSRGVTFGVNAPEVGLSVNCDVVQLRKVVTNLLSNAIKYSRKGDSISLSAMQLGDKVIIKVEDSGVGISPEDLEYIFDRFYQSQRNAQTAMGGTGIGLAFAKGIVELHGGTIEVESKLGCGSSFTVTLPTTLDVTSSAENEPLAQLSFADKSVPHLLPTPHDEPHERQVKLLLVEDDPQLLMLLVEIFSPQYSVSTAVDGVEGIERARELLPQIIVSDVMMPNISGVELCQALKGDELTSHIPIILLTARSTTEQAIEGLNCGADDYIVKPFDVNLLLARSNNLVNNRILLQQRYSAQPEENTVKMASNALDQRILERAMEIIDRHIDNPDFDIATFSTEIAMSRTNLFNKIKAITGLTPNDFILTVRLKRSATMLLTNPNMSITEVAERVGFSGHRHFGKRFKERFGVTPMAYRHSRGEHTTNSESEGE